MSTGWLAVRWLHVVAMALFVGGQLFLAIAVVPALRGGDRAPSARSRGASDGRRWAR